MFNDIIIYFVLKISKHLSEVAGFEPTNGGVKVHSLTTWRHPKRVIQLEDQTSL